MVLAAGTLAAAPANACPPPPPPPEPRPGESEQAYNARLKELAAAQRAEGQAVIATRQATLWNESPIIFVGQVERVRPMQTDGAGPSALIRPVRWIKGKGGANSFWLRHRGMTSCGPYGGGDAVEGKVGQRYIVFASRRRLSSKAVIHSVGAANAVDERIAAALATSPNQR